MYTQILTKRVFSSLFVVVLVVFDANSKPTTLEDNYLSDKKVTLHNSKITTLDHGLYKCDDGRTSDYQNHHHRKRRYVTSPFKFHTMVVLWHVKKFSTKLPRAAQLSVFKQAFDEWDAASRLNFSYTANVTEAHIKISFLTKDHFDSPERTLAHAYHPSSGNEYPGEIHFNEDKNWVTTSSTTSGVNLLAVALHEIGHAIGLKHSKATKSVMRDVIKNTNTKLYDDDIAAIRHMYGKCEVRDLTAVLHDRYGTSGDTLLVMHKNKVWRIKRKDGEIINEPHETWPKDIRDYYRLTDHIYDVAFPLRAAFFAKELNDVYLFGQDHFIRAIPYMDTDRKNGRIYEFRPYTKFVGNWFTGWKKVPEGPLPYSKMDIFHTPDFYKHFLKNNAKFGASYDTGCCYWQHFFRNGTYYKVATHNFNKLLIEDMSVKFPGAPRNPDATWYDNVKNEWYFFKEDRYYKWDAASGMFTDRGPITLLWSTICV